MTSSKSLEAPLLPSHNSNDKTHTRNSVPSNVSSSFSAFANPESYHCFFVGHCREWPENRLEQGDVALYRAYLEAGVPSEQICYLKDDDDCTQQNCQKQLETFLRKTQARPSSATLAPVSTLVFYYGGHGYPAGFDTEGQIWKYSDVVETIDRLFQGERVLFLLDCCASGNLLHHLPHANRNDDHSDNETGDSNNLNNMTSKQFVALCNAPPYVTACDEGEEWILNHYWIQGMKKQPCSLALVTERIADRLAEKLGNQLAVSLGPNVDSQATDWMPQRQALLSNEENNTRERESSSLDWPRLQKHIPKEAQVTEEWTVGDPVFYKHLGGRVEALTEKENEHGDSDQNTSYYVPPGWYMATIIAENDPNIDDSCSCSSIDMVRLKVWYEFQPPNQASWLVEAPRKELLSDLHMGQCWMLPDNFVNVQVELAQHAKYLHYSFLPPQTMVQAWTPNGLLQSAVILDWRDFDWDAEPDDPADDVYCDEPPFGPHVPVYWTLSQRSTLVPVGRILHEQNTRHAKTKKEEDNEDKSIAASETEQANQQQARHALLQSLHTSGKQLCHAHTKVSSVDGEIAVGVVHAYWPEDGQWYKAKPLDPGTVSLEILASHAQFVPPGRYCPLAYDDGEFALSPLHYVRALTDEEEYETRMCCCVCPFSSV